MRVARATLMLVALAFLMGAGGDFGGTDAIAVIREFGFPVFVALWFMWRIEKRMDRFTDAIQNLLTGVALMAKTIDGLGPASSHARAPTHPPSHP